MLIQIGQGLLLKDYYEMRCSMRMGCCQSQPCGQLVPLRQPTALVVVCQQSWMCGGVLELTPESS